MKKIIKLSAFIGVLLFFVSSCFAGIFDRGISDIFGGCFTTKGPLMKIVSNQSGDYSSYNFYLDTATFGAVDKVSSNTLTEAGGVYTAAGVSSNYADFYTALYGSDGSDATGQWSVTGVFPTLAADWVLVGSGANDILWYDYSEEAFVLEDGTNTLTYPYAYEDGAALSFDIYHDPTDGLRMEMGAQTLPTHTGSGDTFYVATDGTNTAPYDTWAKAATNPKTVVDYIESATLTGPHTIYIGAGTFTGTAYCYFDNATYHSNTTVIGAGAGSTILATTSGHAIYGANSATDVKFYNLTINPTASTGAYISAGSTDWVFEDCNFESGSTHAENMLYVAATGFTMNRCTIKHKFTTDKYPLYMLSASSGNVSFCTFAPIDGDGVISGVTLYGSGAIGFHHNVVLGCYGQALLGNSTTGVTANNNILQGGVSNSSAYTVQKVGGTLNLTDNLIIASPWNGDSHWVTGSPDTDSGNIKTNSDPELAGYRGGYILPCVDDSGNFSYAQSVEALLSAQSMKGTYFIETAGWNTANNAALVTMSSGGTMEVACHSLSHSDLAYTGKIWDVTKAAETITISRASDTISLSGGGSVTGFRSKTLADIKDELEALGATVSGASYEEGSTTAGYINGNALGEIFDDGTGVNQIDVLVDSTGATGLFKSEIDDATTYIEGIISSTIGTFGSPYNSLSNDAVTCLKTLNYDFGRGSVTGESGYAYAAKLVDFDMYKVACFGGSLIVAAGTEAAVRQNARAIALAAKYAGLAIPVLVHNTGEMTTDQWTWALAEWAALDGVTVTSCADFESTISSDGDYSESNGVYTKDIDAMPDATIDIDSPCVDSGVTVTGINDGGELDLWGYPVTGSAPNIGASQQYGFESFDGSFALDTDVDIDDDITTLTILKAIAE